MRISPEDRDVLKQYKWYLDSSTGYIKTRVGRTTKYLHRIILERMIGRPPTYTDHINRNKTDNRRENLREVTNSQNMLNGNLRTNNTSGITGVSRFRNRWRAYITIGGKQIHLGYFKTKSRAQLARSKHLIVGSPYQPRTVLRYGKNASWYTPRQFPPLDAEL